MGLFRLLFWIILIAAAFWLWRRLTSKPTASDKPKETTVMTVRCVQCGVHLPREQALQSHDRWYCSQAHLEQDNKSGGN
ncbi:PP0621 family protein [Stutzerimonas chloritidismutans]|uniref:PP0621 family protein n=1 Tax=Stutzerimonas chloritidismutans TaxID=203192 RepID=A0ABU9MF77_STUCH